MIMTDAFRHKSEGSFDPFLFSVKDKITARAVRSRKAAMGTDPSCTRQICAGKGQLHRALAGGPPALAFDGADHGALDEVLLHEGVYHDDGQGCEHDGRSLQDFGGGDDSRVLGEADGVLAGGQHHVGQ